MKDKEGEGSRNSEIEEKKEFRKMEKKKKNN